MTSIKSETGRKPRVLMAMSGGVDSSVAAALLIDQGYEVIGATMQVWDYSNCDITGKDKGTCCSSRDVDDARSVADRLGIPFYVLNCEARFEKMVVQPFVESYLRGETPSPCVNCNTYLKFDHLMTKMRELECQYLATGHYAMIEKNVRGEPVIVTSYDDWKDQTYFLFTLKKNILSHVLFPIGNLKKPDLRQIAEERGLVNARKKDSTGICFIGKRDYDLFIEKRVTTDQIKSGDIRRFPSGEVMGHHNGIHRFTYGQRRGLGMTYHETLFVIKVDPLTGTVWVGDEKYLFSQKLQVMNVNLLDDIQDGEKLRVKIRYHHQGAQAQLTKNEEGYWVEFDEPQRAVTPGQAAVFYRGQQLVGGGWIRI